MYRMEESDIERAIRLPMQPIMMQQPSMYPDGFYSMMNSMGMDQKATYR